MHWVLTRCDGWVVNLTASEMKTYKLEGTLVRIFFLSLKKDDPILIWIFELGRHIALIQILRQEDAGL